MADRAAPPRKADPTAANVMIAAAVGIVLIRHIVVANESPHGDTSVWSTLGGYAITLFCWGIAGVLTASGIGNLRALRRHDATVWPRQYAAWQQTWMCRRCGTPFTPAAAAPVARTIRFRVDGVDRGSGLATTWYCVAGSHAAAVAAADREGIDVSAIQPV